MDLVAESAITNASGEASNVSASASASTTSASASAAAAMLTRHIGRISRAQAARESLLEATSATASVSRSHTFASEGMAISTTASVTEATAFASHPSSNPLLQRPCCVDMSAAFVASNRDASLPLSHDRQSRHKEQPTSERNTSHIAPLQIDTAACEADGLISHLAQALHHAFATEKFGNEPSKSTGEIKRQQYASPFENAWRMLVDTVSCLSKSAIATHDSTHSVWPLAHSALCATVQRISDIAEFRIGSAAALLRASLLHSDSCHLYESLVSLMLPNFDAGDRSAVHSASGATSGSGVTATSAAAATAAASRHVTPHASHHGSAANAEIEALKRQIMLARGRFLEGISAYTHAQCTAAMARWCPPGHFDGDSKSTAIPSCLLGDASAASASSSATSSLSSSLHSSSSHGSPIPESIEALLTAMQRETFRHSTNAHVIAARAWVEHRIQATGASGGLSTSVSSSSSASSSQSSAKNGSALLSSSSLSPRWWQSAMREMVDLVAARCLYLHPLSAHSLRITVCDAITDAMLRWAGEHVPAISTSGLCWLVVDLFAWSYLTAALASASASASSASSLPSSLAANALPSSLLSSNQRRAIAVAAFLTRSAHLCSSSDSASADAAALMGPTDIEAAEASRWARKYRNTTSLSSVTFEGSA